MHGDLHFENVRINPAEAALGLHWLIDPKEFERGDYVYDLAKLLTSLTGHAHADIGENEKGNPRLKWTAAGDGRIDFNCILTPRQVDGWREGLAAIETLAGGVAPRLEAAGESGAGGRRGGDADEAAAAAGAGPALLQRGAVLPPAGGAVAAVRPRDAVPGDVPGCAGRQGPGGVGLVPGLWRERMVGDAMRSLTA